MYSSRSKVCSRSTCEQGQPHTARHVAAVPDCKQTLPSWPLLLFSPIGITDQHCQQQIIGIIGQHCQQQTPQTASLLLEAQVHKQLVCSQHLEAQVHLFYFFIVRTHHNCIEFQILYFVFFSISSWHFYSDNWSICMTFGVHWVLKISYWLLTYLSGSLAVVTNTK